jgi:CheY-like chemotaxis protein
MRRFRIFVAEDSAADLFLLEEALKENHVDYELQVAADGEKASAYLDQYECGTDPACPDLVLLDLNLPKKDGLTLLAGIRQWQRCRGTPVVVLTTSDSPEDRRKALSMGVDRYLLKPTRYDDFIRIGAVLKQVLEQSTML